MVVVRVGKKLVQEGPIPAAVEALLRRRRRDQSGGCEPQQVLRTLEVHGVQGDQWRDERWDRRNDGFWAKELWEVHGAVKSIIIELWQMMMKIF